MSVNFEDNLELYHWHQLIQQACDYADINLQADVQGYLLLTLQRYIRSDALTEQAISMSQNGFRDDKQDWLSIKTAADHCLVLAGLFPSHIDRQSLRISHYIQQGIAGYRRLASLSAGADRKIFTELADVFVQLIDVLYALRLLNGETALAPLQALELWSDTGSRCAYLALTGNNRSLPLSEHQVSADYKH